MNPRKKMYQTNSLIRKELIKLGFYDTQLFPHLRNQKDIFGWDGVCKKKNHIHWIQLSTGYKSKKIKTELRKFCETFGQKGLVIERIKHKVKYKSNKKGSYKKYDIKITELP